MSMQLIGKALAGCRFSNEADAFENVRDSCIIVSIKFTVHCITSLEWRNNWRVISIAISWIDWPLPLNPPTDSLWNHHNRRLSTNFQVRISFVEEKIDFFLRSEWNFSTEITDRRHRHHHHRNLKINNSSWSTRNRHKFSMDFAIWESTIVMICSWPGNSFWRPAIETNESFSGRQPISKMGAGFPRKMLPLPLN